MWKLKTYAGNCVWPTQPSVFLQRCTVHTYGHRVWCLIYCKCGLEYRSVFVLLEILFEKWNSCDKDVDFIISNNSQRSIFYRYVALLQGALVFIWFYFMNFRSLSYWEQTVTITHRLFATKLHHIQLSSIRRTGMVYSWEDPLRITKATMGTSHLRMKISQTYPHSNLGYSANFTN